MPFIFLKPSEGVQNIAAKLVNRCKKKNKMIQKTYPGLIRRASIYQKGYPIPILSTPLPISSQTENF